MPIEFDFAFLLPFALALLATGAFAGTLAGLLGVGGGIVIVPILYMLLPAFGVPEDLRSHLFDPFISTKPGGSGLGLALVAKFVGDHGGVIDLDTQSRRTVFRVMLPMMEGGHE